jgi:hypothetical protein
VGILADGGISVRPLLPVFTQQGDVVVVRYDPHRHDLRQIVETTYARLLHDGYRRVTLAGQSMGMIVAEEIIKLNKRGPLKLRVIADCPTDGRGSVVDTTPSYLAEVFYPGLVWNLATRPFWHFNAPDRPPESIEPGANREAVRQADAVLRRWPLSSATAEGRLVAHRHAPAPGSLKAIPAVVMAANGRKGPGVEPESDGVVYRTAAEAWRQAFNAPPIITVNAGHADTTAAAGAYREAYEKAFEMLGPWT